MNPQEFSYPRKLGERINAHLAAQSFTMHFNGPLAYSQLGGDLFVQETGRDQCENFALARGQRAEAYFEVEAAGCAPYAPHASAAPPLDCGQKRFVVKRLLQDIHSACPHRVHSYRYIVTPGDEDDRHEVAGLLELLLKLQPIHSRHEYIGHDTIEIACVFGRKEFACRRI